MKRVTTEENNGQMKGVTTEENDEQEEESYDGREQRTG
jgi:hypothetical protein